MFITIGGMADDEKTDPTLSRVLSYIKSEGISKTAFSERIGIILQTFNNWEKRGIPAYKLRDIAQEMGISIDELVTGKKPPSDLPIIALAEARSCTGNDDQYKVMVPGGMIPNYPDDSMFLCIPFDGDAKRKAKYVIIKKSDDQAPTICMQTGPSVARTNLAELVGGRRIDHPEYLHPYNSVEILCAIFDVANDSGLWSQE